MGKKIKKKKSKKKVGVRNPIQKEDNFDFGGIPPRELKKNLGCG